MSKREKDVPKDNSKYRKQVELKRQHAAEKDPAKRGKLRVDMLKAQLPRKAKKPVSSEKSKKMTTGIRGRMMNDIEHHGKNLKGILNDVESGRVGRKLSGPHMTADEQKKLSARITKMRKGNKK